MNLKEISGIEFQCKNMLLVDGFVHDINKNMIQIIPREINKICFDYFYIESVEVLKEKRINAKKANDLDKTFEIEQLIVAETCHSNWYINTFDDENIIMFHQEILREVLNHWIVKKKMDYFRNEIIESTKNCIKKNNIKILKMMLKYCGYDKMSNYNKHNMSRRNNEIFEFINIASKYASFECILLLLKYPHKFNWGNQRRPICLFNAVKYNHDNIDLINFIMQQLETVEIMFVCDEIMKEAIRFDLMDVAKRIIDNRWHKLSEEDQLHAQLINGKCFKLFNKRINAFNYFNDNNNNDDDQGLNIDDDEWDDHINDDDDDFDDEDNDWENAEEFQE